MADELSKIKLFQSEFKRFIQFFISELKPKGPLFTPFNIIELFQVDHKPLHILGKFSALK